MPRTTISRADVAAVLATGALLSGLLLPAVAQVRDAEARRRSMNNLKMIVLAVHNYNDASQGKLPPLVDLGVGVPNAAGLNSLFFNLLPYLGEDRVYRMFQKSKPASYYDEQSGAARTIVATYVSPADATAPDGTTAKATVTVSPAPRPPNQKEFTGLYATTSYAANGLIPWNSGVGLPRTFVDGTSNTIMMAERAQVCRPATGDAVYNLWAYGVYGPAAPAFALLAPEGQPSTGQFALANKLPPKPSTDPVPLRVGAVNGKVESPPAAGVPFQVLPGGAKNACVPGVPQTPHADGMLIGIADGSVRLITPKVSQWTFWAACTPNGNEELFPGSW